MEMNKILQVLPEKGKRIYAFLIKAKIPSKLVFILISVLATIWFLIRVIPKPSRAIYPCMQIAAPFMSSLVLWIISIFTSWIGFRLFKKYFLRARHVFVILVLLATSFTFNTIFSSNPIIGKSVVEEWFTRNSPVGEAKGINPGRVVWAHNPDVTSWDGKGYWFYDENTNQTESDKMVNQALQKLTGEESKADAWSALFTHFNKVKNNLDKGYTSGEKICIKVNYNNCHSNTQDNRQLNTSPHLTLSVLRTLINDAGVAQEDITVTDPSRFMMDSYFNLLHSEFPDVVYEDHNGGNGRSKVTYTEDAIKYSVDNADQHRGIANSFINASYVINMAILKGHSGLGITFCGKNWFGATSIDNDYRNNHHNNFWPNTNGNPKYMTFTDFMGHKDLGEKTVLFMIDAFFATQSNSGVPVHKWKMAPFNDDWPSSLFVSQDGVAIDAVAMDFYLEEFPQGPQGNASRLIHSDMYLAEAAQIGNPPSSTAYDPEQDGSVLTGSLGVLEHWNNAIDKQYSRNLNPDANGIELLYTYLGSAPDTIALSVINGNGSGEYAERTVVTVSANPAPEGKEFHQWISSGGVIANKYNPVTTYTILESESQTLTATYQDILSAGQSRMIFNNEAGETGRGEFKMDAEHNKGGNDNTTWFGGGSASDIHLFMYFPQKSLINVGDKLSMTIIYIPGLRATGLNASNSNANSIRLGLFNNNGVEVANNSGISNSSFSTYSGYYGAFGVQSSNSPGIFKRNVGDNSLILGNGAALGTDVQASDLVSSEQNTLKLEVEKTANGISISFMNEGASTMFNFSNNDITDPENTFNTLVLGLDDTPELLDWFYIDLVKIEYYKGNSTSNERLHSGAPEVRVYPDARSEKVIFDFGESNRSYDIILSDLSGKTVAKKYRCNTKSAQLNCEGLKNSIYIFQIISDNRVVKTGKIYYR